MKEYLPNILYYTVYIQYNDSIPKLWYLTSRRIYSWLDVNQTTNHFRLKQLVDFATRGDITLDLILKSWSEY